MHSESPGEDPIEPQPSDSMSGLDPTDNSRPVSGVIDNGAAVIDAASPSSTGNQSTLNSTLPIITNSSGDEAPLSFSSPDNSPPPSANQQPSINLPTSQGQENVLRPSMTARSVSATPGRPPLMRAGTDPSSRPMPPQQHHQQQQYQAEAGPSSSRTSRPRAIRYADPDRHWLSEDEGEMHSNDVTARNRNWQQGSGGHQGGDGRDSDDSGGKDTDADKDQALLARQSTETRSHPINHKPANIKTDLSMLGLAKDYTSLLPSLATITPNLLKSLQCSSCTNLLRDPTTLTCGHSVCLGCSAPDASPIQIQQAAVASAISSTVAEALSPRQQARLLPDTNLDERQASGLPVAGSPEIPQQSSPTSKAKTLFNDVCCPIPTCRKLTKASELSKYGIRTDFVLHKLTSLLRAHIPSISEGFSLSDQIVSQSTREGSEELQNALEELESTPSSSPDENPKDEDGAKRIMGRHRQGKASKRNKGSVRSSGRSSPTIPILVSDVLSELECQVCVTLIYEPITTPCGHTFCKRCLFRSLDHSNRCPLCRSELPGFNFFVTAPFNFTISNLLLTTFPLLYEDRKMAYEAEQRDTGLDTPIFVCMVAFPFMPTNLHIYEPRYRLMMRRAMDSNKRFGMVLPSRSNDGISQYGTMLEIEEIHVFDDGRSLVQTKGVHRFKILETGTLDGYSVGRVERIEDIREEEEAELERPALARSAEQQRQGGIASGATSPAGGRSRAPSIVRRLSRSSPPATAPAQTPPAGAEPQDTSELTNKELIDVCKSFVEALRTGSTPWLRQRLNDSMPPMPDDPREFTWWMAMLMPIDDHEKARLLQITSYRLRLRLLVFWIQQMQHSWWFSRGCTIA